MSTFKVCRNPRFVFRGHASPTNVIDAYDNSLLVSGDQSGTIIIWNLLLKRKIAKVENAHTDSIIAIKIIKLDEFVVISQGRDNCMKAWQLLPEEFSASLLLVTSFPVDSLTFTAFTCIISDYGSWLVSLVDSETNKICVIDLSADSIKNIKSPVFIALGKWTKYSGQDRTAMLMVIKAFITKDALHVACGYEDGSVSINRLDLLDNSFQLLDSKVFDKSPILSIDLSTFSFSTCNTAQANHRDPEENVNQNSQPEENFCSSDDKPDKLQNTNNLAIAVGGAGQNVYVKLLGENGYFGCDIKTISLPNAGVNTVRFLDSDHAQKKDSDNAKIAGPSTTNCFDSSLAVGCWDYRVRIFDVATWQPTIMLLFHSAPVSQLLFVVAQPRFAKLGFIAKAGIDHKSPSGNRADHTKTSLLASSRLPGNHNSVCQVTKSNIQIVVASHDFRLSLWDL